MNNNKKIIGSGILFLILGLGLGWLFFHTGAEKTADQTHQHSAEETTWTCSMHPQIRQNEPGLCPICGMELIPLNTATSEDPQALEMTEAATRLANIQTTEVKESEATKEILLNGRIKADERKVFSQTAHVPGRIEKLYIDYTGKYVQAGEKLAEVYSPELINAQEELLEAKKYAGSNPALLNAARNKLKLWKLSDRQVRAIERSGKVSTTLAIRADVSGYVTEKMVNLGDHLDQGEVMFRIANLDQVWVMFESYESDLAWLSVGDSVSFTVTSLPGQRFEAKISYIDPVIDPKKRVAMVRADVSNKDQKLKPEMFVLGKVSAELESKQSGLVIPESAVMWTGKRSVVYVKDPSKEAPTFRMQEVVLGEKLGEFYLVTEGLEEGQQVVSNGTFTVDAAAQLKGLPSMMNPYAGKEQKTQETEDKLVQLDAPEAFLKQLDAVYQNYLALNEALIASDAAKAKKAAEQVDKSLQATDMTLLKGEAHDQWMKHLQAMNSSLQMIGNAETLEDQRLAYANLNDALYKSIKQFGLHETVYYQYCPMANDFEGGYWLSKQKEIRNPYFGESMLSCGETREVLKEE